MGPGWGLGTQRACAGGPFAVSRSQPVPGAADWPESSPEWPQGTESTDGGATVGTVAARGVSYRSALKREETPTQAHPG